MRFKFVLNCIYTKKIFLRSSSRRNDSREHFQNTQNFYCEICGEISHWKREKKPLEIIKSGIYSSFTSQKFV